MRGTRAVAVALLLALCGCASPLPNGVTRIIAASGSVPVGPPQPFSLRTHCGLDNAVIDFAGVLWDPVGYPGRFPNPPRGLGDPVDQGTIALAGGGSAVFVSSSGIRLDLVAHAGPKDVQVCY